MDKRKLIGTIIGVVMFAALIAGATYAWLTFTATVENATYDGVTQNFIVDYTNGNTIEALPQIARGDAKPSNTASLVVVAKKHTNSVDGHLTISLTTSAADATEKINTDIVKDGVVRWAICRDTNVADTTDNTCGTDDSFANALNTGIITSTGTIHLLHDARLADGVTCTLDTVLGTSYNTGTTTTCGLGSSDTTITGTSSTNYILEADGVSYFVYFWLDSEEIENVHIGQTYNGYIHASATQIIE